MLIGRGIPAVLALGLTGLVAGCALDRPVAVISGHGDMMRGVVKIHPYGGSFQISGKLDGRETTCAGSFTAPGGTTTVSMVVTCNDGRKGIAIASVEYGGYDGSGRLRLEDGTEGDFVFGHAAEAF